MKQGAGKRGRRTGRPDRSRRAAARRDRRRDGLRGRGDWGLPVFLGILGLVLAGAGIVLYLSRGSPEGGVAAPGSTARPADSRPVGALPGQRAPDFTVPTASGEQFRLSAHRGQVVVLDFLAPG